MSPLQRDGDLFTAGGDGREANAGVPSVRPGWTGHLWWLWPWTPELAGDLQGTHGGVLLCACWQWRLCAMPALDKPRGQAGS